MWVDSAAVSAGRRRFSISTTSTSPGHRIRGTHVGMVALLNRLPLLSTWRWRVLHSPTDVQRVRALRPGWTYVGQEDKAPRAAAADGPRVAVLGYLDDPGLPPARPAFEKHLDLCQSTMTT